MLVAFLNLTLGMFPLMLTVHSREVPPNYNPCQGLFVQRGHSRSLTLSGLMQSKDLAVDPPSCGRLTFSSPVKRQSRRKQSAFLVKQGEVLVNCIRLKGIHLSFRLPGELRIFLPKHVLPYTPALSPNPKP